MEGLKLIGRSDLADGSPNPPTLSASHARTGSQSLKFHFEHAYDADRQEVYVRPGVPFTGYNSEVPYGNCEVYYGFSVYLPTPWESTRGGSILHQLQTYLANPASGTTTNNPFFAISENENENGTFNMVARYWNPAMEKRVSYTASLGPVLRDQWIDFQVRAKFSDSPAGGGLTVRRRNPATESTYTTMYHQEGMHGLGFDDADGYYEYGIDYKFGQYKWIYANHEPESGEQTVWEHFQDHHVASHCNEGNWEMVTPPGEGF